MTTPKKPRSASKSTASAPAAELTAGQLRAAQYFAAMDDRTQQDMLEIMAAFADKWPRHKRPALRLISGGTK